MISACGHSFGALAESLALGAENAKSSQPKQLYLKRTLHFPGDKVLGAIWVGNQEKIFGPMRRLKQVAGATGSVTISLRTGDRVMFEANRRVFEHPDCLSQISPVGLDCVKLSFISLDDREDEMCDRALAQVFRLNGITQLDVDRSDATDRGLSSVQNCTTLQGINCYMSSVNGDCLQDLAKLPALKALWLGRCSIKQKTLACLPRFLRLQELDLERTGLDASGVSFLSKCSSLEILGVRGNAKFDDRCLKPILLLQKLRDLDMRETPVTMAGVRTLKALKLQRLCVPEALAKDVPELKRLFPGAFISALSPYGETSAEDMHIYSPLH